MTFEQIEKIKNKVELPVVDTPVFLKYGEVAVYYSQATRCETRNCVVGRKNCDSFYHDVSKRYSGELILTNYRIIFLNTQKGFVVDLNKIISATAYQEGFAFQSMNTSYFLLTPCADLAILAFNGVLTGEIPIRGIDTADVCEEDGEFESDDISYVDGMDGHEFEYFCAELLRRNGFSKVSVTKGSGDQGVDILATKDCIEYAIQCKNYASALGNTSVQEVNAGKTFYNCHVGAVMTNSTFTRGATELAQATGVLLWDRKVLQSMMEASD